MNEIDVFQASLPPEIFEKIVNEVPIKTLENLTLVCKTFNSVLNEQFWKKQIPHGCLSEGVNPKKFVLKYVVEDEEDLLNRINSFIDTIHPDCHKKFTCSFPRLTQETQIQDVKLTINLKGIKGSGSAEKINYVFRNYFKPSSSAFKYFANSTCSEQQRPYFYIKYFNVLEMLDLPCFQYERPIEIKNQIDEFITNLDIKLKKTFGKLEEDFPELEDAIKSGYKYMLIDEYPERFDLTEVENKVANIILGGAERVYAQCEIDAMIVPEASELASEIKMISENEKIINNLAEKIILKSESYNFKQIFFDDIFE